MRLGRLGKGWMSGEMVEGQSSFAINHGNRQKAEWALAFSQEGQAQSNSLSRQTVISNIETMGPWRFFLWSKSIRVGVGGRKAWGLWQLTLDPGNGGIVSLPALQQASIGASSAACWYLCTLWYLVVLRGACQFWQLLPTVHHG